MCMKNEHVAALITRQCDRNQSVASRVPLSQAAVVLLRSNSNDTALPVVVLRINMPRSRLSYMSGDGNRY